MAPNGEGDERRHPQEPENVACPRCDSTNTKFCYYNNYNLSQPRYFCKSCRRFWTRGGTLRNIPVGGGSRKNSKRSRVSSSSSCSSSAAATTAPPPLPPPATLFDDQAVVKLPLQSDVMGLDLNDEGSFTSLLTSSNANATNVAYEVGLGFGFGVGSPGFEEMGFGFGASMNMGDGSQVVGQSDSSNTWQFGSGDGVDGVDCFGWPDLAMSTAGKGLE